MATNFGDFQNEVYAEAVKGVTTRYPFDFASIERKASEALPDWVYRYVSAAAGDGRTIPRPRLTESACSRQVMSSQPRRSVAQWPCMAPTRSTSGGHLASSTRSGTTLACRRALHHARVG